LKLLLKGAKIRNDKLQVEFKLIDLY
jgi:hypothetical protein